MAGGEEEEGKLLCVDHVHGKNKEDKLGLSCAKLSLNWASKLGLIILCIQKVKIVLSSMGLHL
jgi:hypothetical protein